MGRPNKLSFEFDAQQKLAIVGYMTIEIEFVSCGVKANCKKRKINAQR